MKKYLVLFFLLILSRYAIACDDWFNDLKIKDIKNCASICRTSPINMSSFSCTGNCDKLCKKLKTPKKIDDSNYYGLTDDEIKFCKENKIDCLKAYKESWNAEKICLSIYPVSDTNDESDACRHFVWAILLSREIGTAKAETVLSAHENNPKELKEQKSMDVANNRLGLIVFQKNVEKFKTDESIKEAFQKQLKENKLIILIERYKNTGVQK